MKKKLLVPLFAALAFSAAAQHVAPDAAKAAKAAQSITPKEIVTLLLGDANGDGAVNGSDLTSMSSYILGKASSTFYSVAADFNKDGSVNGSDITVESAFILAGTTQTETVTEATKEDEYTDNPQL